MGYNVRKRTFGHGRPPKIKIRLHICIVLSNSLLDPVTKAKEEKILHADKEDFNQTARMCSLFQSSCRSVSVLLRKRLYTVTFIRKSDQYCSRIQFNI